MRQATEFQLSFEAAVRAFWDVRAEQRDKQTREGKVDAGTRGAVTGGAHLDALVAVISSVFEDAGIPATSIFNRKRLVLPGYFRPHKKWDILVVHENKLVAAVELKSQVGSFGNNFNNRAEEAIGNASDLWTAYREGTFGTTKPWLGYFFLLENAPEVLRPVKDPAGIHFPISEGFEGASYLMRYEEFCRRLLLERLYDSVCFVTSNADPAIPLRHPNADLSFEAFATSIQARVAAVG